MGQSRSLVNIGLDYDGTITSDPLLFLSLINVFRSRGHKVYIVTMRYRSECEDIIADFIKICDGIIPTGREAKGPAMEKLGIPIHIWIDDNPRAINESALQIWGDVVPEGSPIVAVHGTKADS